MKQKPISVFTLSVFIVFTYSCIILEQAEVKTLDKYSENDVLRSVQIREGDITREHALKIVYEENRPRMRAIELYLKKFGFTLHDLRFVPVNYKYKGINYFYLSNK